MTIRAAVSLVVLLGAVLGCEQPPADSASESPPRVAASSIDLAAIGPRALAFCGDCHDPPPASSFPKEAWPLEVERGFDFYFESFRTDLEPPPKEAVTAYYQSMAPAELPGLPPEIEANEGSGLRFAPTSSSLPDFEPPAVSYITWRQIQPGGERELIFCDMRSGELRTLSPTDPEANGELLAAFGHPAHVEPCDLDGDGQGELVVAELGSPRSGDHARGAVIWLRREGGQWKQRLLLSGVGRVADVQPGDFDGDGDADLVVAEFGHFRTGRILWLENTGVVDGAPRFQSHVVDDRSGAIHTPTADLNNDGKLDFVALISQEHEVIEAYLNQGDGVFRRERIFSAQDPAYGSSGIQLVDLDADGDLDVLFTNGDTFGSEHLKPHHGIHWLENRGSFPFVDHVLAAMPGVQKSLAGDLDGDGDLDVAAVALMPKNLLAHPDLENRSSVLWLQQTAPGEFIAHALERGRFVHAGLEIADFDHDGDLDLAVGNMYPDEEAIHPWLTIWTNQRNGGEQHVGQGGDVRRSAAE